MSWAWIKAVGPCRSLGEKTISTKMMSQFSVVALEVPQIARLHPRLRTLYQLVSGAPGEVSEPRIRSGLRGGNDDGVRMRGGILHQKTNKRQRSIFQPPVTQMAHHVRPVNAMTNMRAATAEDLHGCGNRSQHPDRVRTLRKRPLSYRKIWQTSKRTGRGEEEDPKLFTKKGTRDLEAQEQLHSTRTIDYSGQSLTCP